MASVVTVLIVAMKSFVLFAGNDAGDDGEYNVEYVVVHHHHQSRPASSKKPVVRDDDDDDGVINY